MNINEFFEIAEKFFDLINPNLCEEYVEEKRECELWKNM